MLALAEGELMVPNIDIVSAVTTALGVLPELRALRAQIAEELPRFDVERYDRLEKYALALNHANVLHRSAVAPRGNVAEMADELTVIRDRLFADALSLANYNLIDGARLAQVKTAVGYRPLATDVFTLIAVLKERWSALQNKTPVTLEALNDAGHRAVELLAAVGQKEQAPVALGDAVERRQRAFTLFVRGYEDARRAVLYLRDAHGDADDIAPSLYAGRSRRRGENAPAAEPAAEGTRPSASAPGSSSTSSNGGAPDIEIDNSAGLPITRPFTSN
jgi:hypothetical protein